MIRKRFALHMLVLLGLLLSALGPTVVSVPRSVQAAPVAQTGSVCTALQPLPTSAHTGEKPQSKVWTYGGDWWSVLPSSSPGTWLWRLQGTTWTEVLKLSDETDTAADVKHVGSGVHILLYDSDPELVSVEYVGGTYQV